MAPADRRSYRITGFPWLGASDTRTFRGMTVSKSWALKCCLTSSLTCPESAVRPSNTWRGVRVTTVRSVRDDRRRRGQGLTPNDATRAAAATARAHRLPLRAELHRGTMKGLRLCRRTRLRRGSRGGPSLTSWVSGSPSHARGASSLTSWVSEPPFHRHSVYSSRPAPADPTARSRGSRAEALLGVSPRPRTGPSGPT